MVTLSQGRRVEHEIVKGTMKSLTVSKILSVEYPPQIPAPHTRTGTPVNSPVRMVANTTVGAQQRLDLAYDHQGRRITKRRWSITADRQRLHPGKPRGTRTNLHKFMNNAQPGGAEAQLDLQ
jgi:hypothetical protein